MWPTVIAEGLVTGQKKNIEWINLDDGGAMISYLSGLSNEKEYSGIIESIKEQIRYNKNIDNPNNPDVVKRYIDSLGNDNLAYDSIKKIFIKKELKSIIKKSGKRKRNIFCWLVATLLLEYVPETIQ
jgi:hypothetical protein